MKATEAMKNIKAAIESYKRAQASTPLPDYAAALYDLYRDSGQTAEAEKQMELIDAIDKIGQAAQERANRNVAMIYADHDHRVDRALELAQAELDVRRDIYTYDALAWALYKNRKYPDAAKAIADALKLGTPEPMFYYHAEKIALANGQTKQAEEYRKRYDTRSLPGAYRQNDGSESDRRAAQ